MCQRRQSTRTCRWTKRQTSGFGCLRCWHVGVSVCRCIADWDDWDAVQQCTAKKDRGGDYRFRQCTKTIKDLCNPMCILFFLPDVSVVFIAKCETCEPKNTRKSCGSFHAFSKLFWGCFRLFQTNKWFQTRALSKTNLIQTVILKVVFNQKSCCLGLKKGLVEKTYQIDLRQKKTNQVYWVIPSPTRTPCFWQGSAGSAIVFESFWQIVWKYMW